MNQNELMHSGVKGMRWGVRKARPSSGSGGTKSAKKTITPAQKKAARAKVKAKATKIKNARLSALEKSRNETAKRAMEKAERSIFGVGMAKVPGKIEFYRSVVTGGLVNSRTGETTKVHTIEAINTKKILKRAAIGAAVAGLVAANY